MPGQNEVEDPLKAAQDLADEIKAKSQKTYNENIDRVTYAWGGGWRDLFAESDYDFTKYLRRNVPWDLNPMFEVDSGWPRKLIWWFAFLSIGIFAVVKLMKPEFDKYWAHQTTTNVYTEYANSIALPIVTLCPNGNGLKCDCLLWKKIVCEFKDDREFVGFRETFFQNVCDMVKIENNGPFDPDVEALCMDDGEWTKLGWESDKCGKNGLSGQDLYYTIRNRTEDGQPFVSAEELLLYGAVIYDDLDVTLNTPSLIDERVPVNESWINKHYLALELRRVCTQITPLNGYNISTTQNNPGSENGLKIMIRNTFENIISSTSYAGTDVFVTIPTVPGATAVGGVALDNPLPVSGGVVSTISYAVNKDIRLNDWGLDSISKNCQVDKDAETHHLCVQKKRLNYIAETCEFCVDTLNASFFNREGSVSFQSYGCDTTCHDTITVPVDYDDCPIMCDTTSNRLSIFTERLSNYGRLANAEKDLSIGYLELNIGAATFDVTVKQENMAQTFGMMTGNVGGFTNLYFGPDFMSVMVYIETVLFGFLLSFRTWDDEEEEEGYY